MNLDYEVLRKKQLEDFFNKKRSMKLKENLHELLNSANQDPELIR